jgi:hypothetical protein
LCIRPSPAVRDSSRTSNLKHPVTTVASVRAFLLLYFAQSGKRPFRLGKGHEFQGPDYMKSLRWFDVAGSWSCAASQALNALPPSALLLSPIRGERRRRERISAWGGAQRNPREWLLASFLRRMSVIDGPFAIRPLRSTPTARKVGDVPLRMSRNQANRDVRLVALRNRNQPTPSDRALKRRRSGILKMETSGESPAAPSEPYRVRMTRDEIVHSASRESI